MLGLSIPFLLADHLIGTRVALTLFGTDKSYVQELLKFWVFSPPAGLQQFALLLIVWIHGSIGVHFWLRLKPAYPPVRNLLLSVAVLLPALALVGSYQGGKQIARLAENRSWLAEATTPGRIGSADQNALLVRYRGQTLAVLAAILASVVLARAVRRWRERRVGLIELTYPDRAIRVPRGLSVLEASLLHNIPHAHVCGGRGRCSTCRIRLLGDFKNLPEPSPAEQTVLERVGAGVGVRLACQLRPAANIAFVPLLPPHTAVADVRRGWPASSGDERYLVIMFVDLRGSSKLAERRLPYDTVFIINQFLNAVSRAVIASGGEPNQVLGDGLLALFGLSVSPETACRQAVAACAAMAANVAAVNRALAHDLPEPLRFGVGVHAGVTVAGDIGYERHAQFTVIGDPVNVAARLQDLTKSFGCEVLISEDVYAQAGFGPDDLPAYEVDARGREAKVKVRSASLASDLAAYTTAKAG
jgi:adenylate cyclase